MRDKIAAMFAKRDGWAWTKRYPTKRYREMYLGFADQILALFAESLPLEGLTLEEHNQVVRRLHFAAIEACRECPYHPPTNRCEPCEVYKALTLNGKPVKVRERRRQ